MKAPERGEYSSSISSTMLAGLRVQRPDAWKRLVQVWEPVIYGLCRKYDIQAGDAADIAQNVFLKVFRNARQFHRGSFRAWITTIARNQIMDFFRGGNKSPTARGGSSAARSIQNLPDPHGARGDDSSSIRDIVPDAVIVRRVLEVIRGDFEERTFQAFWQTTVEGRSTGDVAQDLGMTVEAVRQAKSRVLRRLREESEGMY